MGLSVQRQLRFDYDLNKKRIDRSYQNYTFRGVFLHGSCTRAPSRDWISPRSNQLIQSQSIDQKQQSTMLLFQQKSFPLFCQRIGSFAWWFMRCVHFAKFCAKLTALRTLQLFKSKIKKLGEFCLGQNIFGVRCSALLCGLISLFYYTHDAAYS